MKIQTKGLVRTELKLAIFDYEHLKDMILNSAPRRFLYKKELIETEETEKIKPEDTKDNWNRLIWLLLALITLGGVIYFSNRRKKTDVQQATLLRSQRRPFLI